MLLIFTAPSFGQWKIYDGSILPTETSSGGDSLDFPKLSDNSPGTDFVELIMDDENIAGNKILQYLQPTPSAKLRYEHDFSSGFTGTSFTIVARLKGTGDNETYARVCDIEWRNGNSGTRDELRIIPADSTIELNKSGKRVKVNMNLNSWHIYRVEVMGDSSAVYVDEDTVAVLGAVTATTTSNKYFKFGDGSGDAVGGYVDWIIFAEDTAARPQDLAVPDTLTGLEWNVYAANQLPLDYSDAFSESNVDITTTMTDTIIEDPDDAANHLLELIVPNAQKYMYKYSFAADEPVMTLVARVKSIEGYDRAMEFDLQQGGFRERLYIKSDNTFELKESGVKGSLPNMTNWHIFRITKNADAVKVYVDEKPEPIAEVTTATTSGENYFRFGDGNGSSTVGGLLDYVAWSTKGAFAPGELVVPDSLSTIYVDSDATLKELSVSAGDLVPAFDPMVTSYAVNVGMEMVSTTIIAVPNSDRATVEGDGTFDLPGTAVVKVTAEDSTVMEYTIHFPAANDSTLTELTVSSGTLTPAFDPAVMNYTVELENTVTSVTVTAKASNEFATVAGDGDFTTLPGSDTIMVTAPNGNVSEYIIVFSYVPLSSDNSLKELSVDVGTMDPAFSSTVYSYTVLVPLNTTSITITAVANDTTATVEGDGEFTTIPGTATIKVTAQDGGVQNYELAVDFEDGISESENMISIYPNPASGQLNVKLSEFSGKSTIRIINTLGVVVSELTVQQQLTTINVANYPSGIYMIQVENSGKVLINSLVIK